MQLQPLGRGHDAALGCGQDLFSARASVFDEHAAQVPAIAFDHIGGEGQALADVDEMVFFNPGIPAGLRHPIHRHVIAVARERLQLPVQVDAERAQHDRQHEVRRGNAGDRSAGHQHHVKLVVVAHARGRHEHRGGERHRQRQAQVVRHQHGRHEQHARWRSASGSGQIEQSQQALKQLRHQQRQQRQRQRAGDQTQGVSVESIQRQPGHQGARSSAAHTAHASRSRASSAALVASSSKTAASSTGGPGHPASANSTPAKLRVD